MNLGTNAAHAIGETSGFVEIRLEGVDVSDDRPAASTGLPPGRYARFRPLVALVTSVLYFRLKAARNEVPATEPEPADWGQQPAT